ncbi:hypothetical protein NK213_14535 [Sebaldella sp. S0638]|nr:hypothetical protein [Sebaldella sp. S0638]
MYRVRVWKKLKKGVLTGNLFFFKIKKPVKSQTNSIKRLNKGITKKIRLECLHKKRKKFFFIKLLHEAQRWASFIMFGFWK